MIIVKVNGVASRCYHVAFILPARVVRKVEYFLGPCFCHFLYHVVSQFDICGIHFAKFKRFDVFLNDTKNAVHARMFVIV